MYRYSTQRTYKLPEVVVCLSRSVHSNQNTKDGVISSLFGFLVEPVTPLVWNYNTVCLKRSEKSIT